MKILSCILFSLTGLVFQAAGQEHPDSIIKREMRIRRIPGLQLAVVKGGRIVYHKNYGIASIENNLPVTDSSIFSINSCTKAFTGVAMMQLVQAGKVDLHAPVSAYLDSLPDAWKPVTILQLLTHVSGLPDILRMPDETDEIKAWQEVIAMPMEFPTGTQFSYNQTNYALLAKIITKLSGRPFATYYQQEIFRKADMRHTLFGDFFSVIPNAVETYRFTRRMYGAALDTSVLTRNYEVFAPYRRAASGLKSTATDLAGWIMALQQQKLLTDSSLKTLWTAGKYNNGQPTQWALGWVTKPRPEHPAITASGGGRSAFFVYPEDDMGIIVLTNLAGANPEDFIDELAGYFNPAIPLADPVTVLKTRLHTFSFENALGIVQQEQKKNKNFLLNEHDLNDWAYRMMSNGMLPEASAIFRLVVYLFPDSWNAYDSYGEALMRSNRKSEAIQMYQHSLQLNPDNKNGALILQRLTTP
ncbi:serine hydrolase [Chitinophaga sp. Cy-1792]|uniref:serine hydrolase n=1 Tax=Chitinophaga sp. Cy-1792 TaxID=2608339 RepID=UPI00142147EF|nr:serine hydrolase [Chitinophaga sp. Cy-1792]NIG56407.1 serine hydrolase [Chitinophaga sp. Cy-1792]